MCDEFNACHLFSFCLRPFLCDELVDGDVRVLKYLKK